MRVEQAAVIYGSDDRVEPGRQVVHVSRLGFDETIAALEAAIAAEDLWVVARLDPQMLLAKGGFRIHPARQLLYFHPRYMARLLAINPAAIVEAPLKLVVLAAADGSVTVRHPDIIAAFAAYEDMQALAGELGDITKRIVAAIVDRSGGA